MATQASTYTYSRSRPPSETALKVEALLDRYPDLHEQDLTTLIDALPYLRAVDYAQITADERLTGKLMAFSRDHAARLKASATPLLGALAVAAFLAAGLLSWIFLG